LAAKVLLVYLYVQVLSTSI